MKYKLIKSFPGSDRLGSIYYKGGEYYTHGLKAQMVESSPEFFASYLFTDELGNEVYQGDDYYAVVLKDYPNGRCFKGDVLNQDILTNYVTVNTTIIDKNVNDGYWKMFSTREAAQKWIEEQNKPKFEKSEWLYCEDKFGKEFEMLFRYSKSEKSTLIQGMDIFGTECYTIWNAAHGNKIEIDKEELNCCFEQECDKATPEQILDILSKVAIHKGFKEGVKYKSALTGNSFIVSSINFEWDGEGLSTVNKRFNGFIYKDGEWAEIVEDVPEYVECIKEDVSLKPGNIYKVKSQNSWNGILNDIYYIEGLVAPYYCKNFKASTKEAYDAQFQTKEMTITLNGDVINTSHWGNNIKIVYK